jgi:hypothetical protein
MARKISSEEKITSHRKANLMHFRFHFQTCLASSWIPTLLGRVAALLWWIAALLWWIAALLWWIAALLGRVARLRRPLLLALWRAVPLRRLAVFSLWWGSAITLRRLAILALRRLAILLRRRLSVLALGGRCTIALRRGAVSLLKQG